MITWIVILLLYGAVLFGFGYLGGLRAAGKSIESWGRWSATARPGSRSVS